MHRLEPHAIVQRTDKIREQRLVEAFVIPIPHFAKNDLLCILMHVCRPFDFIDDMKGFVEAKVMNAIVQVIKTCYYGNVAVLYNVPVNVVSFRCLRLEKARDAPRQTQAACSKDKRLDQRLRQHPHEKMHELCGRKDAKK
jgi:hypothetical protein